MHSEKPLSTTANLSEAGKEEFINFFRDLLGKGTICFNIGNLRYKVSVSQFAGGDSFSFCVTGFLDGMVTPDPYNSASGYFFKNQIKIQDGDIETLIFLVKNISASKASLAPVTSYVAGEVVERTRNEIERV